jgi:predicted DNA-binding transcriptional regulator AlpA
MDRTRDLLLDTKQTAILLGVSVRTILRWKVSGRMPKPAIQLKNKCLWSRSEIFQKFQNRTESDMTLGT